MILEGGRDKFPRRAFIFGSGRIIHRQGVVSSPDPGIRRRDPQRASAGRGKTIGGNHGVHRPAAKVLGAGVVHGAVAKNIGEVVAAVGGAERDPLAGAERGTPEQSEPIIARGGECRERWRTVLGAIYRVLQPILIGPTGRAAFGIVLHGGGDIRRVSCPLGHLPGQGRGHFFANIHLRRFRDARPHRFARDK